MLGSLIAIVAIIVGLYGVGLIVDGVRFLMWLRRKGD